MVGGAPSGKTIFFSPVTIVTGAVDPDDIGEVLHRPGTKKNGEVIPSSGGPLGGNQKDLRPHLSLCPIEFGKAQVIADAETDLEPAKLDNAWGFALGITEVLSLRGEKVDFIVGGKELPTMIEEEKAVVYLLSCESGKTSAGSEAIARGHSLPLFKNFFKGTFLRERLHIPGSNGPHLGENYKVYLCPGKLRKGGKDQRCVSG
jgi:hypothetical protein